VLSALIRIVMRVVLGFYRGRGRELGLGRAEAGALSFVQRSGGSLNANCHLHAIVIDGIYTRDQSSGAPRFHLVDPPSAAELGQMGTAICERVCKMLQRRGLVGEANHQSHEAEQVLEALQACRTVALSRDRFERLDEHGRAQGRPLSCARRCSTLVRPVACPSKTPSGAFDLRINGRWRSRTRPHYG
jgi:hypothetical protein